MGNVQVCWGLKPKSKPPLWQSGGQRREGEEEDTGREGRAFLSLLPLCQPLDAFHSAPAPEKPPVGGSRWMDREGTATATWEPTRRRAEKEGKKAGGREQGREAGGREEEREERGRDGGKTRTKNRGAGAGKGCREGAADRGGLEAPGSGGRGLGGRIVQLLQTSQA